MQARWSFSVLDQSDVSSQAAEPSSPSTDPTPGPVAQPAEAPRRELASLDEALRQTSGRPRHAAARGDDRSRANGSGTRGHSAAEVRTSAQASTSTWPQRTAGSSPDRPTDAASGDSASDEASKPEPDDVDETDDATTTERPSRRERAEIKRLAAERDQAAAERDQLRQHLTVSPEVYQQAIASRLSDAEFERLAVKKQREDLSGDYLTAEEAARLSQAIQVREWSLPWYLDAQKQVSQWSQAEWTRIQHDQAKAISATMRGRDYLKPEQVARAGSWDHILEHFCDASFEAGAASKLPDIEDLKAELADARAELAGSRVKLSARGRALERGGTAGGSFNAAPDYKTASAGDLFEAAMRRQSDAARRRARRTG